MSVAGFRRARDSDPTRFATTCFQLSLRKKSVRPVGKEGRRARLCEVSSLTTSPPRESPFSLLLLLPELSLQSGFLINLDARVGQNTL